MRLQSRLRRLLKHRGVRINEVVRQGLRDFIATVYEENPHASDPDANGEAEAEADSDDQALPVRNLQHTITCPHCGEPIAIDLDLSGEDQDDVQDCTVCCSPIHVTYSVQEGRLADFMNEPY